MRRWSTRELRKCDELLGEEFDEYSAEKFQKTDLGLAPGPTDGHFVLGRRCDDATHPGGSVRAMALPLLSFSRVRKLFDGSHVVKARNEMLHFGRAHLELEGLRNILRLLLWMPSFRHNRPVKAFATKSDGLLPSFFVNELPRADEFAAESSVLVQQPDDRVMLKKVAKQQTPQGRSHLFYRRTPRDLSWQFGYGGGTAVVDPGSKFEALHFV